MTDSEDDIGYDTAGDGDLDFSDQDLETTNRIATAPEKIQPSIKWYANWDC
jgi:hypothetical protein